MTSAVEPVPWQQPIAAAPHEIWDVLIAGAGPAGSIAALHLAARGHRVLLLDKQHFPRDKTCGDVLIADALGALQRAGLLEAALQLGYQTQHGSVFSPSRIEYPVRGRYLTLKRRLLDALIARKAVEAGAAFCHGEVKSLAMAPDGFIACSFGGSRQVCRARVGVIATGANVDLLRKLGLPVCPKASGLAVRCYVRSVSGFERLVASCDRSIVPGYAWIFPMGQQEYNIGCGIVYRGNGRDHTNLRAMFRKFTAGFPLARALLRGGQAISSLRGAFLRCGLKGILPSGENHILAIGEAIGATFPSTGEGIGKAMETAELAAEVIHDGLRSGDLSRLRKFSTQLEERLRFRYLGYEIAERGLSKPWLHDLVARRARTSRFLQESIAGIINETIDPRTVYSWRGVLQSFWR
jgi:menaquinone-9 beta-reductase